MPLCEIGLIDTNSSSFIFDKSRENFRLSNDIIDDRMNRSNNLKIRFNLKLV